MTPAYNVSITTHEPLRPWRTPFGAWALFFYASSREEAQQLAADFFEARGFVFSETVEYVKTAKERWS